MLKAVYTVGNAITVWLVQVLGPEGELPIIIIIAKLFYYTLYQIMPRGYAIV